MSDNIIRTAVTAHAKAEPVDPHPHYPVRINHSAGYVRKAAEELLAASPLPRWLPDIKWGIVEVHRYPDPDILVGHSGRYMAGKHAIAFLIVRDAGAGDHWLHFRVCESLTPFVEVVHSREHHKMLEEANPNAHPSPSRRFDWITHCTPRSVEELGAWLGALEYAAAEAKQRRRDALHRRITEQYGSVEDAPKELRTALAAHDKKGKP